MEIRDQVPLAPLTTLKVGGPARHFAEAHSSSEVEEALSWAAERRLPVFVLGGGSNLVVADRGFPGLVLKISIEGIEETGDSGRRVFVAGAGENWDALVARTVRQGCAGIECLSGIPGTAGGTPVQNVGAYGQEVAESITEVHVFDRQRGAARTLKNTECGFQYRASAFNSTERDRYIVLRVAFALRPGGEPTVKYPDLRKLLEPNGRPTLAQVREAVRQVRRSKAMLIEEGDPDARSAGSFFKNPVLDEAHFTELRARTKQQGCEPPHFPAGEGRHKVPAAWLVEHAGFPKGHRRGAVGISSKHALAIINRGGATASEIVQLKNDIQQRVHDSFGVKLEPEPVFVGFDVTE